MKIYYLQDGHGNWWNGYGFVPQANDAIPFYCKDCAGSVLRTLMMKHTKYPVPLGIIERSLTREEESSVVQFLARAR